MERKTVGKISQELLLKPDRKQGVIDTQREMNKEFIPGLEECVRRHKHWDKPFYVVVINKRERLMVNVIRQYFLARKTLPTPDYDQSVFKYTPATGDLEFLWVVPDIQTVTLLAHNMIDIPNEQFELAGFCRLFEQGQLDIVRGK